MKRSNHFNLFTKDDKSKSKESSVQNKRSKHFNYFTKDNDPEEKRKTNLKKIWKWLRASFYVLIGGITLTGCVQTFTVKTSSNTGTGVEFTSSRELVSPKVIALGVSEESTGVKVNEDNDNIETINIKTYKVNTNINPVIENTEDLATLRKQLNGDNNSLGYFQQDNSQTVAISKLVDANDRGQNLIGKDEGTLLAGSVFYDSNNAYRKYNPYVAKNKFTDIFLINGGLKYLTQVEVTDSKTKETRKEFRYTTDPNDSNIQKDENGDLKVVWVDPIAKIKNYQNLSLEEWNAADVNDKAFRAKERKLHIQMFNRDVLQEYYNFSFITNGEEIKARLNGLEPSKFLKSKFDSISKEAKNNAIEQDIKNSPSQTALFTLTLAQAQLLNKYNQMVTDWLKTIGGFTYVAAATENIPAPDANASEEEKEEHKNNLAAKNKEQNFNFDNTFEIYKADDTPGTLAFWGADPNLLNISTWGEAWKYGPFYGLFVYPVSWATQGITKGIGYLNGWGAILVIFLITFIIRALVFGLTFNSTAKQTLQEELKSKRASIEAKYVGFEQNKAMKARKAQELQQLHKKYNISPLDQLATLLVTMPIFITMWRVIQAIPAIKSTTLFGVINFASQSTSKISSDISTNWPYLILVIIAILIQGLSMLLPSMLNRKRFRERTSIAEQNALKKQERTQRIMMIVFTVIVIFFGAGVQVYWIITGLFTIVQTLIIHRLKRTQWFKEKYSLKAMLRK